MKNHAAVYLAVFLSVLYLTVSVASSGIASARGSTFALLVFLFVFSIKLAVDDFVHFQLIPPSSKGLAKDLKFSLLTFLLIAAAIACAAGDAQRWSLCALGISMLLGLWWMELNPPTEESGCRRLGWQVTNLSCVLVCMVALMPFPLDEEAKALLYWLLVGLSAFDAVRYGTFERLASLE